MDKILFLNETDRNASYKTEYRYKIAKPVKAAKPKRDEAGFIIPYAMFRPIREPGLICELLGDTPVRRSADLKMNLDYLMKEAYEHAIEQIMCGVRLQEVRCQMQFNAEDRAWEHYTRLREKGQYSLHQQHGILFGATLYNSRLMLSTALAVAVPCSPNRHLELCGIALVGFTDSALTIRLPFCIKRHCLNWQYFTNLTYVCENALTTEGDDVIMLS